MTDPTQAEISAEIAAASAVPGHPRLDYPPYRSSLLRHPHHALVAVDPEAAELAAPVFGTRDVAAGESDLTAGWAGDPIGERMTITGRVLDAHGRPVAGQLVEIWQANAAGRYRHAGDRHPAPLDPNFSGTGRCLTGSAGDYTFTTVKPGPYPWRNHRNAWRPAHIHFSLFGTAFTERLVTQMYFPGDPLIPLDPILSSVTDATARALLIATYDHDRSVPETSTGYRWDIVLGRTWAQ
ncbi:protocatechuate 3,4-dioxygenase subunit beta [Pseudonocardia sp.]|uniref:protocatechuate 3,4-dioxygenase subunit beta n=1 Tax=Pseudonocardia sp. TaxID=60912 RepID=UPI003D0974AF